MSQPGETQNDFLRSQARDKEVKLFFVLAYFKEESNLMGDAPGFVERPVDVIERYRLC